MINETARRVRMGAIAIALGSSAAVAGCAGTYGGNEVSASGAREVSTVREGTVIAVREVTITKDNNILGAATGAVLGGIAGSQIGGGDAEKTAGGVAGAVIGGIAGSEISKSANRRPGFAYVVRFKDGETKEIVQGADIYMEEGTPVFVTFATSGARISPRQTRSAQTGY